MSSSSIRELQSSLLPVDTVQPGAENHTASLRPAAVLVLLFPGESGPAFFLTERPEGLSRHAGQISLPGGRMEVGDRTLWQTALRETAEELGIRTGRVRPLGQVEPVLVRVSGYLVSAFVGWNPVRPVLRPDSREVAAVVEVPLAALLDPQAVREETWELRGAQWRVCFYHLGEKRVWGATARILHHLVRRLQPGRTTPREPGAVWPA